MSAELADPLPDGLLTADATKAEFRVIARGESRRGIRLERIFWQTVKKLAEREKVTIGRLIEAIAGQDAGATNLASAIRVSCMSWVTARNAYLESLTNVGTVNSILAAVPTPAFALGANKKIIAFNPAFQNLVRRLLPSSDSGDQRADLKLALDVNVLDLVARLNTNGNTPVLTGFAIGVGDRRFRGQLNAVKAPSSDVDIVLAFVVS